jgi:HPt (histidine-containing phosphotransfer) domain-containing protein/CheY-like chemotaxis protein
VLADVQMPGDTGSRLAGKLRLACPATTLLLAISGSQPPQKTISRFDGFLLKPFTMEAIATAVSSLGHRADAEEVAEKKSPRGVPPTPVDSSVTPASIYASAPQTASNNGMEEHEQQPKPSPLILAPAPTDRPVLDETIYRRLAGSIPTQQLQEMYAMCVQDARERITRMRTLMEEHDRARFMREAHSLKGSCGMLGATQRHAMAAELEGDGLETAARQAAQEVNSLDELSAACDRLERMLGSRV